MGTDSSAATCSAGSCTGPRISLFVGVVVGRHGPGHRRHHRRHRRRRSAGGSTRSSCAIVDVLLAIPGILLAIGIVAWLDRGLPQIMFAVAVTNVPIFARILRGSMLSLRESDYVTAARSIGAPTAAILLRHMLPNSLTPLIVAARSPWRRRSSMSPASASWASARRTRGRRSGGRC